MARIKPEILEMANATGINPMMCSHLEPCGPSFRFRMRRDGVEFKYVASVPEIEKASGCDREEARKLAFREAYQYKNDVLTGVIPNSEGTVVAKVCYKMTPCTKGSKETDRLKDVTCKECLNWVEKQLLEAAVPVS